MRARVRPTEFPCAKWNQSLKDSRESEETRCRDHTIYALGYASMYKTLFPKRRDRALFAVSDGLS
jgi:hypothetical protein